MTYYVNAILDTATGEVLRYVIAEDGLTLGLGINETVYRRKPLTDYFGTDFPVEIITRRELASASIRVQIAGLRQELGKARAGLVSRERVGGGVFWEEGERT